MVVIAMVFLSWTLCADSLYSPADNCGVIAFALRDVRSRLLSEPQMSVEVEVSPMQLVDLLNG